MEEKNLDEKLVEEKKETADVVEEITTEEELVVENDSVETVSEDVVEKEENMEDLLKEYEDELDSLEEGTMIEGVIFSIGTDDVVVSLQSMFDGVALKKEIEEEHRKVGEKLSFEIVKVDDAEGQVILSRKGALEVEIIQTLNVAVENNLTIKVKVKEVIKGGLRIEYKGLRGFMPYSQIDLMPVENAEDWIGRELICSVIEWNDDEKNLVVSRRKNLEIDRDKKQAEFYENLVIDEVCEGKVYKLFKAGALVDLCGAMGYLHINDASWTRVKDIEEVVKVGDIIKVQIKSFDEKEKRIGLSLKDITVNPWDLVNQDYSVGDVVYGKIIKDIKSGLLIELETGLVGYIHKSQIIALKWQIDQEITVEIERIDEQERRINLLYFDKNAVADEYESESKEETTLGDLFGDLFDKIDQ